MGLDIFKWQGNHPNPDVRRHAVDKTDIEDLSSYTSDSTHKDTCMYATLKMKDHQESLSIAASFCNFEEVCFVALDKITSLENLYYVFQHAKNSNIKEAAKDKAYTINKEGFNSFLEKKRLIKEKKKSLNKSKQKPILLGIMVGLVLGSPIIAVYLTLSYKFLIASVIFFDMGPTKHGSHGFLKGFIFLIGACFIILPILVGSTFSYSKKESSNNLQLEKSDYEGVRKASFISSFTIAATIGGIIAIVIYYWEYFIT